MFESEWREGKIAAVMFQRLRVSLSERKLRLFTLACCRSLQNAITPEKLSEAIDIAERYADGLTRGNERKDAWRWARNAEAESDDLTWSAGDGWIQDLLAHTFATRLARAALTPHGEATGPILAVLPGEWPQTVCCAQLARDVFGNPLHPIIFDPRPLAPSVVAIAQAAYGERAIPSGALDADRLAILSDALEDAGCTDDAVLTHLRGPGPHVRGCWALDLVLGKE